jgi:hypothetical protein
LSFGIRATPLENLISEKMRPIGELLMLRKVCSIEVVAIALGY